MTTTDARPVAPNRPRGSASAVLRTEATLFGRELGSLFWILAFPTLLLVVLGFVPDFTEPDEALGGQRVIDLYASVLENLEGLGFGEPAMVPARPEGVEEVHPAGHL